MILIDTKTKIIAYIIGTLLIIFVIWYITSTGIHANGGRVEDAITDRSRSVERIQDENREIEVRLSELSEYTTKANILLDQCKKEVRQETNKLKLQRNLSLLADLVVVVAK